MASRRARIITVIAFGGALILFGLIGAVGSTMKVIDGRASLVWPAVEGEILLSMRRRGKSRLKRVEYRYEVAGAEHTGTRAAFVRTPWIRPLSEVYKTGQRVSVHYDSDDPAFAVLDPGALLIGVLAMVLAPVLLTGFGTVVMVHGLRR